MYMAIPLAAAALNVFILCFYSKRPLHILQLNNYRPGEYFAHLRREWKSFLPEIYASFGGAAVCVLFYFLLPDRAAGFYWIGLSPYFAAAVYLAAKTLLAKTKKPLALTSRLKRLYAVHCVLLFLFRAVLFIAFYTLNQDRNFSLFPLHLSFFISLSLVLIYPIAALSAAASMIARLKASTASASEEARRRSAGGT